MKLRIFILQLFFQLSTLSAQESCRELLSKAKAKCGEDVIHWLEGAALEFGFSLSSGVMDVYKKEGDLIATQESPLGYSPYLSFRLGTNYISNSAFAYDFVFGYQSLFGFTQSMSRGDWIEEGDVDTYFKASNYFVTPSLRYVVGGGKEEELKGWSFHLGLGIGMGVSDIRGVAYLTEDKSNTLCYETGTEVLIQDLNWSQLEDDCERISYQEWGWGLSVGLYFGLRYSEWILSLGTDMVSIQNLKYEFSSGTIQLKLSYLFFI